MRARKGEFILKAEIRLSSDVQEPYVIIYASKLTPEIQAIVQLLEEEEKEQQHILTGRREESIFVLEPENIQIIRTEGKEIAVYDTAQERYILGKRLYEIEALLSAQFVRISKSAIINIRRIDYMDAGFNGLFVVMKNGLQEYISRRYVSAFKKKLGL